MFSVKGHIVNSFSIVGHTVSITLFDLAGVGQQQPPAYINE